MTNLVHEFPTFLYSLFVHGARLVMRVEVVMVWLESNLHHSNEPPAFLQVPCHGSGRVGQSGRQMRQGSGRGGPNRRLDLGGPGGGDPEPPGEDSARVANSSHGPTAGGCRWKEG